MSSWILQQQQQREAAQRKAEEAERREARGRIEAVRAQTDALVAVESAVARERAELIEACDRTLAASDDRRASEVAIAEAIDLEERLDALRAHMVESAASALGTEVIQLVAVPASVSQPHEASSATGLNEERAYEDARAELRSAIEKARAASTKAGSVRRSPHASALREDARPAAPRADGAATTARARSEIRAAAAVSRGRAAQAAVKAGCAALAACIPALPKSARGPVADELATLGQLAAHDATTAATALADLQARVLALTMSHAEERRVRRSLHRSCAAKLDRLTASADARPALAARAWDLRGRLAGALSESSLDDLRAILDEVDDLSAAAEEAVAAEETRATVDALMSAFENAGYQVGEADGGSFVARGNGDVGLRVAADSSGNVRTEAVRLEVASPVDADGVCRTVDDALDAIRRDASLPFVLAEKARHVPQPAAELEFVDPGKVAWRAAPAQAAAPAANALYHEERNR